MKTVSLSPKHVVFVRHGESEGDVRRALNNSQQPMLKHPHNEEQTKLGHEQSQAAGAWIAKFILQEFNIFRFDTYRTSPLIRTKQSANSTGLVNGWVDEPRLSERDRGSVQGLTTLQHKQLFNDSYLGMIKHPFYWVPPGGESLLKVSNRITELAEEISLNYDTAIFMTHRDVMWAAHVHMDSTCLDDIESVDTNLIGNSHIYHYTNVSPIDGGLDGHLRWKRSVNPRNDVVEINGTLDWIDLDKSLPK